MAWYELWKRNTDDPLRKTFLETYRLNLLPVPLEDTLVGDICIYDGNDIVARSSITDFLEKPYQIPSITISKIPDISGIMSRAVSVDIGINVLESFITAFGIGSIIQKIHASFQSNGVSSLKFRFTNAVRNSINVVRVANDLIKNSFSISESHPLYSKGNQYYLVSAAARTRSLSIITQGNDQKTVNIDANILQIGEASSGAKIENSTDGELTFNGKDSLAFGVELHLLDYDQAKKTFKINALRKYVGLRGTLPDARNPVFIEGMERNAFLETGILKIVKWNQL